MRARDELETHKQRLALLTLTEDTKPAFLHVASHLGDFVSICGRVREPRLKGRQCQRQSEGPLQPVATSSARGSPCGVTAHRGQSLRFRKAENYYSRNTSVVLRLPGGNSAHI